MRPRVSTALTASVLVGVLVAATAQGAVASPVADSTATAVTGQLLRNGKAVSGGDILVTVWPKASVLAAQKIGDPVDTRVIHRGKTATGGKFAIPIEVSSLPAEFVGRDGQVDIEITAADATDQTVWATSVLRSERTALARRQPGWTTAVAVAEGSPQVLDVTLDLGTASSGSSDQPAPTKATVAPRNRALLSQPVAQSFSKASPADVCVTYSAGDVKNRLEHFGRVYGWKGARGVVDFNVGSSHTLGIAAGKEKKWSAAGSATISTDAGATVKGLIDAETMNRVNYRDYKNLCWSHTRRRPVSFSALLPSGDFKKTKHKNFKTCAAYDGNATVWKTKGRNATYTSGVALPYVNVSAQSGWTTSTKEGFEITKKSWICGSTDDGWAKAPQMSARRRK